MLGPTIQSILYCNNYVVMVGTERIILLYLQQYQPLVKETVRHNHGLKQAMQSSIASDNWQCYPKTSMASASIKSIASAHCSSEQPCLEARNLQNGSEWVVNN